MGAGRSARQAGPVSRRRTPLLAFHAEPAGRWEFSWVRYQQPPDQKPVMSSSSPAMARFDPLPLRSAVMGLYYEVESGVAPPTASHWVEIIHLYVMRFSRPWQTDDRLGHLWEYVAARLGEPWNLDRLAQRCHLSSEHLRRLCRRELGRSPMQHVIYLRMQQAAKLLSTTDDKIETIAARFRLRKPFRLFDDLQEMGRLAPQRIPRAAKVTE